MENQTTSIEELIEKTRKYVETRLDLFKLKAIDKSAALMSVIISILLVFLIFLVCVVLINIGLALIIGEWLGKAYYGFLIMAGVNAVAGLVLYLLKDKIIKTPISNSLIKNLLD